MPTFSDKIISFHRQLKPNWNIPKEVELIYPFELEETWSVFELFYSRYFSDNNQRTILFGINPGRKGAGVTGVAFTDPKILQEELGIENTFKKHNELSALFVYDVINAYGGPDEFYKHFYITSVCPLGFIAKGKNVNYYDSKDLQNAVEHHIIKNIITQKAFGANPKVAFSMGQGKNFKYLKSLNDKHQFFEKIVPLPHPRWVMQYRLKRKQEFIDEYLTKLHDALQS